MKSEHPEVKLNLSTFYKLCPKNYKKAQRKTDMCQICIKEKRVDNSFTSNTINRFQNEIQIYHHHLFFKEKQKNFYQQSINSVTNSSCVVVIDFKQNFKVGGGPIETNQQFYTKK